MSACAALDERGPTPCQGSVPPIAWDYDPAVPGSQELADTAKAACRSCPVREACLSAALAYGSSSVSGALTPGNGAEGPSRARPRGGSLRFLHGDEVVIPAGLAEELLHVVRPLVSIAGRPLSRDLLELLQALALAAFVEDVSPARNRPGEGGSAGDTSDGQSWVAPAERPRWWASER